VASITFAGVTKVFRDGTVAVRGLDLVVEEGELFVLLGASGSGKSTILRLVAGLEGATEGRILLDDDDVTDLPPPKRDVAMVFQQLALYPHLNVFENIAFGVRAHGLKRQEVDDRVRAVAATLGLDDVLRKRPRSLSGGQAQRVALGRAIVRNPRAFLMDEPLSSLDERLRIELRGELARIQGDVGVTMVYVTHDQTEAMTLGHRIGVLREGALEQVHTPRALYDHPTSLFVAGFVGSPPMNLAEATVDRSEEGDLVLVFGGHRVRVDGETAGLRPRLWDYVRRQVVIGIRPEHLRDVAGRPVAEDARLRVPVARTENSGADTYAQFVMDTPLLLSEDPRDPDETTFDGSWPAERVNLWMAKLSAPVSVGDVIDLSLDAGRLHVFDPRTGETIER
jgi:multiple sugar transport system ATP-binding protein